MTARPWRPLSHEGVHGFLQHALFVADDDVGRLELEQVSQPVVPVDHAPVKVVQVRRSEPAALQGHQRPQVGRDHRQHCQDHPLRPRLAADKALHELQPLAELLADLFALGGVELDFQLFGHFVEIHLLEQFTHAFGAHFRDELRAVLFQAPRDIPSR